MAENTVVLHRRLRTESIRGVTLELPFYPFKTFYDMIEKNLIEVKAFRSSYLQAQFGDVVALIQQVRETPVAYRAADAWPIKALSRK